ncbi:hypothetical protein LTR56_011624 [Elasticomyces elasticus]|nr:hypothetical protein LTR56_011624 [Elasticomyces elasticus]KAK3647969.1 hypothetical protein LTR22_013582 [Elasticomyces elasticus]KAK4905340.1 hypothetical protein LTR49_025363 [Elasticomyces elasticus]KAK5765342.1 hypothetical protein LTS12_004599 [Elasticomyces elasticus]
MAQIPEAGMNDVLGVLNRIADNLSTLNESMSLLVTAQQQSVQDPGRPMDVQEPEITPVPYPSASQKAVSSEEPETTPVPNIRAGPTVWGLGSWQHHATRGTDDNPGGRVLGELAMEEDENTIDQMLSLLAEGPVSERGEYSSCRSWRPPGKSWT